MKLPGASNPTFRNSWSRSELCLQPSAAPAAFLRPMAKAVVYQPNEAPRDVALEEDDSEERDGTEYPNS